MVVRVKRSLGKICGLFHDYESPYNIRKLRNCLREFEIWLYFYRTRRAEMPPIAGKKFRGDDLSS